MAYIHKITSPLTINPFSFQCAKSILTRVNSRIIHTQNIFASANYLCAPSSRSFSSCSLICGNVKCAEISQVIPTSSVVCAPISNVSTVPHSQSTSHVHKSSSLHLSTSMTGVEKIKSDPELIRLQKQLQSHCLYPMIRNKSRVQFFMKNHSFPVWDFMPLLKGLQRGLTCTNKFWTPAENAFVARFINMIVLGEESDEVKPGLVMSHYEMYLKAMNNVGADTRPITTFVSGVASGKSPIHLLNTAPIPEYTKVFVRNTLKTLDESLLDQIGSFFFAREDPIPQMFQQVVQALPAGEDYEFINLYLNRHIQVDAEDHGPMSEQLLEIMCQGKDDKCDIILRAGKNGIRHRIMLWDGMAADIKRLGI
jgi:hypothetical protein